MIWSYETPQRAPKESSRNNLGRTAVLPALLHLACSSSGGAAPVSNEQPAHSRTSNVAETSPPRVPSARDGLVGRWWGYLPEGQAAVLELSEGEDGTLSATAWTSGTKREGTLRSDTGTIWGYRDTKALKECSSFVLNTASDQLECRDAGETTFVLHRSKALRIRELEAGSTREPRSMGFDATGSRFVFGDDANMFVWHADRQALGDLGSRVSGVVFSKNGRYVAYHRRAADSGGVTELMLFDAQTNETRFIASRVPWAEEFARFSPNGAHLVYFGNCLTKRECDIEWLSLDDGSSEVIGTGRGLTPYVVFGPSSERFVFGTQEDAIAGQLLAVDTATKEVQLLADGVTDVTSTPDGARVGFTDDEGGTRLWDAATGEVHVLVSPSSWELHSYRSGITLSDSGRFVALLKIDGHLSVRDTLHEYSEPFVKAGRGVHCSSAPGGQPRAVIFVGESGMMSWPRPHDQSYSCDGGIPPLTFQWSEVSGEIQLPGVTMGQNPAFGPTGEVLTDGADISYWSKERGAVSVWPFPSGESVYLEPGVSFVRNGELVVFAVRRVNDIRQLYTWDVDAAKLTELGAAPFDSFQWYADPTSGDVVQLATANPPALNLWRFGHDAATILIDEVTELTPSSSRRAIASDGRRRDERGVFTYRFGDEEAAWLEAGKVLAVSDSHVFFLAEDGVCVQTF